ncbi:MAG TPA: hydroxyacid dehydrogenase [Rhodospirillaceae bacterium]|nr:MAG: hypothetical protein A2018_02825 [Alphaproteobacteria bacterium GWF2_58_20]HAU29419.1 hydroxyacid dehydrogenase [Rhodospirillaceae bacterium]
METHVIFFDSRSYERPFFDMENAAHGFRFHHSHGRLDESTLPLASGCDVVCAFVNDDLSAPIIRRLAEMGVKLIAMRCAGINNVDMAVAEECGIPVVHVPAYSPSAVAEHAVGMMLSLNRKIHKAYTRTREGNFSLRGLMGFDMAGKVAAIVGTGKIGKIAARILRGFDMDVLLHDPYPDEAFAAEIGARYVDLCELHQKADIISLHCPLTKDTYHLVGEECLAVAKPGVMIINTGRGGLIDTNALIKALKSGKVGAAGLDVYEEEGQFFFEDHSTDVLTDDILARLLTFSNVLVTAHQAFFTKEAMEAIARTTMCNIAAFARGESLPDQVHKMPG